MKTMIQKHFDLIDGGFASVSYTSDGARLILTPPEDAQMEVTDEDETGMYLTWGLGLGMFITLDDAVRMHSMIGATLYDLAYRGEDRKEEPF